MMIHYLRMSWRSIRRRKGYAFINVAGLGVGIASCLLIFLYVHDELTYDRFHVDADRMYRIVEERTSPQEGSRKLGWTAGPVGPSMVREFPEVRAATRFTRVYGRQIIQHANTRFYLDDYLFAESSFFDVFSFGLVRGNRNTALNAPNSVLITEHTAHKFFGGREALGSTLTVEQIGDVTVTGVLRDLPGNSHLDFSMLFSMSTLENKLVVWDAFIHDWTSSRGQFLTYVLLDDPAKAGAVSTRLESLAQRHQDARSEEAFSLELQMLRDIHFRSADIENELNAGERAFIYVYVFSAIGVFILLIACINYINLATAQSLQRAREVGMRKVIGARRGQLVAQFLSESVLIVSAAFIFGLILCKVALPFLNGLSQKEIVFNLADNLPIVGVLTAAAGVIGLFAGAYPSLVLSRFKPAAVLKGTGFGPPTASRFRSALVVTQFGLSSALLVATLIVQQQLQYVQNKNLGFDKDHLVVVDINSSEVRRNFETVKAELGRIPGVIGVATSSGIPGDWKDIPQFATIRVNTPESRSTMTFLGVDEDFLDTYEVALLEGRNFEPGRSADSAAVLLNHTAVRMLGLENPVGERITLPEVEFSSDLVGVVQKADFDVEVIGVAQDFHFRSLHEAIGPLILGFRTNPLLPIDYFTVRISAENVPATMARISDIGERVDPAHPFEASFLDQRLDQFYQAEQRARSAVGAGALVAVIIACLGLLGLATFTVDRLTKEIGIRKVLGASASSVAVLISKDFFKSALLGAVIASPIAYVVMNRWLEQFAFRIEIHWSTFLLIALFVCAVATMTVGYQSARAALLDPVCALRHE